MPMATARRLCPQAVVVPVRGERYREVSQRMFAILEDFSPLIEPLSIDEAFVDLTGTQRLLGPPEIVGQRLRARIRGELGLTASVGIAPNKFLAKVGSDLDKPDGLTLIRPEDVARVLDPLPITRLWGLGPATAKRLEPLCVRTVGELKVVPLERLTKYLGKEAPWFLSLARGEDDRLVTPDREAKSIGHEVTFSSDIEDPAEVRRVLFEQVEQVGYRLRHHALAARGVAVKIRYGDFETINRSATLAAATRATLELWQAGEALFERWVKQSFQPVRLIGFTAERLSPAPAPGDSGGGQMDLFVDPQRQKQQRVDAVADQIVARFGRQAVRRGGPGGKGQ